MLGWLGRALRARKTDPQPLGESGGYWGGLGFGKVIIDWLNGGPVAENGTGVDVDEWKALNFSAVWCAQRIIAEAIATLPITLNARNEDGSARPLVNHPANKLIAQQPNPEMPPYAFKETLTHHVCGWGNGYAEIERANSGAPLALWPVSPNRVTPTRDPRLGYLVDEPDGGQVFIPATDMLHIPGLGFDGLVGYSVIGMAKHSVALGLAAERYGGSWFGGGAIPGGVLQYPGKLKEGAKENIRKSWMRLHGGVTKVNRIAILEEGMEYKQIGLPPGDSQFLETRKFQIQEIARWYRVPLHMLYEGSPPSGVAVEQLGLEFVNFTLMPWLTRWCEHSANKLLSRREKDLGYFYEFNLDRLLKADMLTRFRCYAIGRQWGFYSGNDIARAEGRPLLDSPHADEYLVPMNMAGSLGGDLNPASDPASQSAEGGEADKNGKKRQ